MKLNCPVLAVLVVFAIAFAGGAVVDNTNKDVHEFVADAVQPNE